MAASFISKLAGSGGGAAATAAQRVQPELKDIPATAAAAAEVTAMDRLLFAANVLIGYRVEVQVKTGCVYEGIFHTMQIAGSDVHVVLKYAKLLRDPGEKPGSVKDSLAVKPQATMTLLSRDLVQVLAKDVRFNPEDLGPDDRNDDGFGTDAAIGRARGGATWGRELQAWVPDADDDGALLSLEGDSGGSGWDQFAVNREKFGVESTFDEHIYTTRIDRKNCAISEEEAERLAREIEGGFSSTTANLHQLEERGIMGDDTGDMDEEDKYSAVVRPGASQAAAPAPQQHGGYGGYGGGYGGQGGYAGGYDRRPRYGQHPPAPPAPRAPAWGGAGSGIAAVAGRMPGRGVPPPPPPPPSRGPNAAATPTPSAATSSGGAAPEPSAVNGTSASAGGAPAASAATDAAGGAASTSTPIDIDPLRREANKVRSQLMAETGTVIAKRDRSSPFGTPKGLKDSPLVHDPESMRALHLMPGKTAVPPDVDKDFKAWKQQQQQQQGQDKKPQGLIDDLKKFSSNLTVPGFKPSPDKPEAGAAAGTAAATPTADGGAAPVAAAASAEDQKATADGEAGKGDGAAAGAAAAAGGGDASAPKKSSLNPNAKPFSLNFNAKPFVPPGLASAPAAAGAGPAAAAATGTASTGGPAVTGGDVPGAAPFSAAGGPGAAIVGSGASSSGGLAAGPGPAGGAFPHGGPAGAHHSGGGGGMAPHHSRSGSGGAGMHLRPDREPRVGSSGGMDRRGPGLGGRMGMGMGGGDGHFVPGGAHHGGMGMQGPGGHKMMGGMGGGGGHHLGGEHHPGGPGEHMHKGGGSHMGMGGPEMMGGHKGPHMGGGEHMGHKGAPPPPHHGPGGPMEVQGAMMQGMPMHGMPPHMGGPMQMAAGAYMQMAPAYHMGPGGAMVPAGPGMIPTPMYPAMRPGMSPNGGPVIMQYSYPMAMPAGAQGPGGRPPFFQGMQMVGMAGPMMAGPMPPMEHAPRMGGPGSGGNTTPTGSKGMRGPRREGGGFHADGGRQHHAGGAGAAHHAGGAGPSEGGEPQAQQQE